jgi:hypothetical protein
MASFWKVGMRRLNERNEEEMSSPAPERVDLRQCDTDEAIHWVESPVADTCIRYISSGNTCEGLKRSGKLHLKRDKYGSRQRNRTGEKMSSQHHYLVKN